MSDRPNSQDCQHVFGPYFTRMPFKVYWLKCYRCLLRYGPYLRVDRVKAEAVRLRDIGGLG